MVERIFVLRHADVSSASEDGDAGHPERPEGRGDPAGDLPAGRGRRATVVPPTPETPAEPGRPATSTRCCSARRAAGHARRGRRAGRRPARACAPLLAGPRVRRHRRRRGVHRRRRRGPAPGGRLVPRGRVRRGHGRGPRTGTRAHPGRLASWQVDLVLDQLAGGTGLRAGLSVEQAYATAERLLPELEPLLIHAWRLQLAASVDRVSTTRDPRRRGPPDRGFADLVGFTELSRRLEQRELGQPGRGVRAAGRGLSRRGGHGW